MKKNCLFWAAALISAVLFLLPSCNTGTNPEQENQSEETDDDENNTPEESDDDTESTPDETNDYTSNASSRDITSDDSASFAFDNVIYINLSTTSCSSDGNEWTEITSDGVTVLTDSDENKITAAYDSSNGGITVSSKKSSQSLQVVVSGTSENAHLYFENKKGVTFGVKLDDVTISSTGNYPAISFDKNAAVYLETEGTNSITDGRKYGYGYGEDYADTSANPVSDGADTKGTIYSKGALLLNGDGTLTLVEGYKHGIYSKDYIRIFGGAWTINSSGRNGIQSVNGFIMDNGTVTITGTGNNTNNQSRGIIVEGEETTEGNAGEGFIIINDGEINITTVSKAMSAKWDIDDDAETSDTSDDPNPYVRITGGKINIKTTGTPADESKYTYTFTDADGVSVTETTKLSPEGIEGKQSVYIEGGELNLVCTDDCINASRSGYAELEISGGKIYAYSSNNDAIDSNGTLTISGGTIVAMTSTTPECAFDCDNYTFKITGGTLVGIGTTNYSAPTASVCTQSTIILTGDYLGSAGKTFTIGTSETDPVFAYTLDSSIFNKMDSSYVAIISSPNIQTGTTYTLYNNAEVSGGEDFNGLYTEMPDVSSASSKLTGISTSDSSYVYKKSSSKNGGAKEGEHQNPWDNDGFKF